MTRFGLLVPHFGAHADRDLLSDGARLAERSGFDSLWVRDHLVYQPHLMEDPDTTFLESFVTLAFLAGRTESIGLGTAILTPFRNPVHTAHIVASLSWLSGRRLDLGIGAGNFQHEFDVAGMGAADRPRSMKEQVAIARRLWEGHRVSHQGDNYAFEDVQLVPTPRQPVPVWWGGSTPAATRLAVDFCDGWLPGQITFATYQERVAAIRAMSTERARGPVLLGAVPLISLGRTTEEAIACLDLPALLAHANAQRYWVRPPSGRFQSLEDLEGWVLAGTPDAVANGIARYEELGAELIVLDLRLRFDVWLEQIEWLTTEVLRLNERDDR